MEEFSNSEPSMKEPTDSEKQMAMLSHLGGLAGFIFPFGNIIVPVAIWIAKKDNSSYVAMHGLESINFQISMTIAAIIAGFLCFILIGIPLLIGVCIMGVVFPIIGGVKANDGFDYRYPMTVRLIS